MSSRLHSGSASCSKWMSRHAPAGAASTSGLAASSRCSAFRASTAPSSSLGICNTVPGMRRLKDLRAYVDALDELGELQRIDAEVSLDYELGAIVRRSYDLMAPAPLFTNMTGVEPGFRVLG